MIYLIPYEPESRRKDMQKEHLLGRKLLAYGLSEEYQIVGIPVEDMVCHLAGEKPILQSFPEISFNITHTQGLVGCAISRYCVGMDAEQIRSFDIRLMKKVCSLSEISYICEGICSVKNKLETIVFTKEDEEKITHNRKCQERFFKLWTLKESYVKAMGKGIAFPFQMITFRIEEDVTDGERIICNIPNWKFSQFRFQNNYIIAVCEECTQKEDKIC